MDLAKDAFAELKTYFRHFDPRHERENEFFTKLGYIDFTKRNGRLSGFRPRRAAGFSGYRIAIFNESLINIVAGLSRFRCPECFHVSSGFFGNQAVVIFDNGFFG
jgi:hypothetical protein